MRRFWLGIALLVIFLGLGLWAAASMDSIHQPIAALLEQAAAAALREDWEGAEALSRNARDQWEFHRPVTACVADHTPMDEIDSLFAQLPIFVKEAESADFAAACAELSQKVQAMSAAHNLSWWNLL